MKKKLMIFVIFLIVLTPVFSQNNGFTNFRIYIDNESPINDFFAGLSIITNIEETFYAYAHWTDDGRLKHYVFEWDREGYLVNDTAQPFVEGWSNISKTFNSADEGKVINYKFYAFDGMLNSESTTYRQLVIANQKPANTILEQDNENPIIGSIVKITSYWTDNFEVDHIVLQTNESGTWHDNGSPINIDLPSGWANFTIDTTGMNAGTPYHWRLTGKDQVGNDNTTPIQYFTPQ